jgi:hypothetical protein
MASEIPSSQLQRMTVAILTEAVSFNHLIASRRVVVLFWRARDTECDQPERKTRTRLALAFNHSSSVPSVLSPQIYFFVAARSSFNALSRSSIYFPKCLPAAARKPLSMPQNRERRLARRLVLHWHPRYGRPRQKKRLRDAIAHSPSLQHHPIRHRRPRPHLSVPVAPPPSRR